VRGGGRATPEGSRHRPDAVRRVSHRWRSGREPDVLPRIPAESLVSAVSGEYDLDVLSGAFREKIKRQSRGDRKRLVAVPREPGQELRRIRAEIDFTVVRTELIRDPARERAFVEHVEATERRRKGVHPAARRRLHEGYDRTRVEAAAQKSADGDVRNEVRPHGEPKALLELPHGTTRQDR